MSRVPKTTTISLRIDKPTAAEWRERAAASGLSVSDWIRGSVDAGQQTNLPTPQRRPVRVRDTSNDADPALMRQLAALGSNLNQIARSLNECRLVGAPVRLVEVLALLRQGLEGAPRTRYSTEIHGEFAAIDHALGRLAPGDLCLVLVDQVEEALAHLQQRIASV